MSFLIDWAEPDNSMAPYAVETNGVQHIENARNGSFKKVHVVPDAEGSELALNNASLFIQDAFIDGQWIQKQNKFDVYSECNPLLVLKLLERKSLNDWKTPQVPQSLDKLRIAMRMTSTRPLRQRTPHNNCIGRTRQLRNAEAFSVVGTI